MKRKLPSFLLALSLLTGLALPAGLTLSRSAWFPLPFCNLFPAFPRIFSSQFLSKWV